MQSTKIAWAALRMFIALNNGDAESGYIQESCKDAQSKYNDQWKEARFLLEEELC